MHPRVFQCGTTGHVFSTSKTITTTGRDEAGTRLEVMARVAILSPRLPGLQTPSHLLRISTKTAQRLTA